VKADYERECLEITWWGSEELFHVEQFFAGSRFCHRSCVSSGGIMRVAGEMVSPPP